jgi:hypothetical protein
MAIVDRMKPEMRALVHEFGFEIVHGMLADGWNDAEKLRPELEAWRERQQEAWLQEIPYGRLPASRGQPVPQ